MILWLRCDDVLVFESETDVIPPPGSIVEFSMAMTVGAIRRGVLVSATVSGEHPARYDYETVAPEVVVEVNISEIEVLQE